MATDEQLATLVGLAKTNFPAKIPKGQRERWIFFFVRRGVWRLNNEGWSVDSPQMIQRLRQERDAATAFLTEELGSGPDSLANRTPAHLDLADVCKTHTNSKAAAVKPRVTKAIEDRKDRVSKIAIRALAAHDELWNISADRTTVAVEKEATREIIDRRLRMVERMLFNVNGGSDETLTWTVTTPRSWTDTFRTRIFEYPYIPANGGGTALLATAAASTVVLPLHKGSREANYQQTAQEQWDWLKVMFIDENNKEALRELLWDEPPPFPESSSPDDPPPISASGRAIVNARLPTKRLRWAFKVSPADSNALRFFPQPVQAPAGQALKLSEAIDSLMYDPASPKADYWDRAWMYCDHVIAALHIEALLFARRRRSGKGPADAEIDGLAGFTPPAPATLLHPGAYVWFGSIPEEALSTPSGHHGGLLDGRPDNIYFKTLLKQPDSFRSEHDLELGDQVIFYNSGIYELLTSGALGLENATITDVGTNETTGKIDSAKLRFAGHGLVGDFSGYTKEFYDTINTELGQARAAIAKALQLVPSKDLVPLATGHHVIRWAPYPLSPAAVAAIGPWWLVCPLKTPAKTSFKPVAQDISRAVRFMPGTFGFPDPQGGAQTVVTATRPASGGVPTIQTIQTGPQFTLFDPAPLGLTQDQLVLFPIAEPKVKPVAADGTTPAWGRYFARRAQGQVTTTLTPLKADASHIPGLFDEDGKVVSTSPKVRP